MNPAPAHLIWKSAMAIKNFDAYQYYLDYHTRWVDEIGVDAIMQTSYDFQDGRQIRMIMVLGHFFEIVDNINEAMRQISHSDII